MSARVTVPVIAVPSIVGTNLTLSWQDVPGATGLPGAHVVVAGSIDVFVVGVTAATSKTSVPMFSTITCCGALCVPKTVVPREI